MIGAKKIILFGSAPGWVLRGAKIDIDFANGRYYGGVLASLLSCSRASQGTDLLPISASGSTYNTFGNNILRITPTKGLLIEEARTNQLLNSTVPATQTTASLGTGTYTLWVNGAGSALASGGTATIAGAAPASNGSPNTFTVTVAGTVVVTVTNPLNAFQLELGAFGTSLIVTGGSIATRAADAITAINALATPFATITQGSIIALSNLVAQNGAVLCPFLAGPGSGRVFGAVSGGTAALKSAWNAGSTSLSTVNSANWAAANKSGLSWDATGQSLVLNNGTVATSANTLNAIANAPVGSNGTSTNFLDGYLQRLALWNARLPDAAMKALTI